MFCTNRMLHSTEVGFSRWHSPMELLANSAHLVPSLPCSNLFLISDNKKYCYLEMRLNRRAQYGDKTSKNFKNLISTNSFVFIQMMLRVQS